MSNISCPECSQSMRDDMVRCPHCCRPCLFPNVNAARRPEEQEELQRRYASAHYAATAKGTEAELNAYETAVGKTEAVVSRSFAELQRLTYSEDEIYATFYQRVDAGLRLAGGDGWDKLRVTADTILFGDQNKREVRFASLTLDGYGLPHYGECSLVLREEMIGHRATVFEENSVMFMHHQKVNARNDYKIPVGHRAEWSKRAILASAKTKGDTSKLDAAGHPVFLQHAGKCEKNDVFIEVHIWGSLTIRSIGKVSIRTWKTNSPSNAEIQAVTEKLASYDVAFTLPASS